MATADSDGVVRFWALPSGRPAGRAIEVGPGLEDISLSPDGATLVLTRGAEGVEIVDAATGRRRATLEDAESISGFARFTPDGRFLMASSYKGWARLWSTETWRPATRAFAGHAGPVTWQSISPDGRMLATGSTDGAIRLFDLRAQRAVGAPLPGLGNLFVVPQFSPDGRYLYALYASGRAYRWDIRPSSWARHACTVAGRRLTRSEWTDALPDRDYAPACGQER
jgi:WD40 repeat protein